MTENEHTPYQTEPKKAAVTHLDSDGNEREEIFPNVVIRPNGWVEYWFDSAPDERFAYPPHKVTAVYWSEDLGIGESDQ